LLAAIKDYDGVLGVHDLVIHQYGAVKKFASVHVEVDRRNDIVQSHQLIDRIERDVSRRLGCDLVIHMDPVDTQCLVTDNYRQMLAGILTEIDPALTFHDFQINEGTTKKDLVFDVMIPFEYKGDMEELRERIRAKIIEADSSLNPVIKIDREHIP